MSLTAIHSTSPQPKAEGCCPQEKFKFDTLTSIIEKISAVALGIFAAYMDWELFVPFFFAGACIGVYSCPQNKTPCNPSFPVSSCTNSLLEQLTGVKLPPIIALVINIAVTVCHIEHHTAIYVPIIGISLGAWGFRLVHG